MKHFEEWIKSLDHPQRQRRLNTTDLATQISELYIWYTNEALKHSEGAAGLDQD